MLGLTQTAVVVLGSKCALYKNVVEYGGWFVPCRIIVFRGEKAPRENPPNCDFFVFSHGDLSPRHTNYDTFMRRLLASCWSYLRLAGWKVAMRKPKITIWRVFAWQPFAFSPLFVAWRGERSPRENPPNCVFAWRPFAPPHESTRHSMRCVFGYCLSYLCLAERKVAMRKPAKITIWRVFAWQPFAVSPRKHVYTTRHKSATIGWVWQLLLK